MLLNKLLRRLAKRILYQPYGLKKFGRDSAFRLPRTLRNKECIEVGDAFLMGRYGLIFPVTQYEGVKYNPRVVIADNVYIGGFTQIHCASKIEIEDGCVLSEYCYISDISHGLDPNSGPIMKQPLITNDVLIKKNTFVGYGCHILPGVVLGEHCVVGSNSVVTKSFSDYSMIAGSPAKLIKKYDLNKGNWRKVDNLGVFIDE